MVLGKGLGIFIGRPVVTSEGRISVRLMNTRAEFPEHQFTINDVWPQHYMSFPVH
jgi:hypothetical protein